MGSWPFSLQHNAEGFQKIFSPKYPLCSLHGGDFTLLPTERHTYVPYHPGCGPNSTSGAYLDCTQLLVLYCYPPLLEPFLV